MKTIQNQWSIYKIAIAFMMLIFAVISCEKDDNFSDNVPDYTESIVQSFKVGSKYADINHTIGTITMTLPSGTDLKNVKPEIRLPESASVTPASGSTIDFSNGPVTFEVVSTNGAHRTYTASIAAYGDPKILSFSIGDKLGIIDEVNKTIKVEIGSQGGDLSNLAPSFVIAEGTTVDVASGVARNFTSPKVYTVLSNNGYTAKQYTVTVTQIQAPRIESFVVNGAVGIVDNTANSIVVILPPGTNLTNLAPVITLPAEQTITPSSGAAQNFSNGSVTYTVKNKENLTKVYNVKVESIAATKYAFLGLEDNISSLVDDDAKAAATWMQSTYGADFKYIKIADISALNIGDVKVAMLYYLTPKENQGFSATSSDVSNMLPAGLRPGGSQAQVLKSWVKGGGDMLIAGDPSPFIFSLGRVPANFGAARAPGNYVFSEFGCATETGCYDTGKPSDDIWGLGMRDTNNSGNRRNDAIFDGLTFEGGAGNEYLPLQNSANREVRLIWWQHFDGILNPSCCGSDAASQFEKTLTAVKYGTLRHIGDAFGYGAVEFKRTDLANNAAFDSQIPTDYKGHIFTISNTIVGYEWNSNGTTNDYQNNIKVFTKNILDHLYNLNND
ncbi:hypothetical protein [Flavobacterium gawalongense]|uniref:DUF4960 domain-containing protein n=1 Tax=Flavobacterium gawalongense TaxID=2594432 RepID=A0ABY3CHI8_9FLAO|nr:hypothetical protein [Flavobacterium gawalongense]TRX03295.1 hypothetical protein FNW12_15515 [Flavobacterium gawalongense]TRX03903.1 hypothetical protein FNW33_02225 [Flavobacterium gawalongense]